MYVGFIGELCLGVSLCVTHVLHTDRISHDCRVDYILCGISIAKYSRLSLKKDTFSGNLWDEHYASVL